MQGLFNLALDTRGQLASRLRGADCVVNVLSPLAQGFAARGRLFGTGAAKRACSAVARAVTRAAAIIRGGVYTNDVTNPSDSDFEASGVTTANFVKNASLRGDSLKLVSDGTYWYAKAFTAVYDGVNLV